MYKVILDDLKEPSNVVQAYIACLAELVIVVAPMRCYSIPP